VGGQAPLFDAGLAWGWENGVGHLLTGRLPQRGPETFSVVFSVVFLVKIAGRRYNQAMNDFFKGMASVGQLFPAPASCPDYPHRDSAWQGVVNSFYQTGNNLRTAIKEFSDTRQKRK
jgi:hypothetical protein